MKMFYIYEQLHISSLHMVSYIYNPFNCVLRIFLFLDNIWLCNLNGDLWPGSRNLFNSWKNLLNFIHLRYMILGLAHFCVIFRLSILISFISLLRLLFCRVGRWIFLLGSRNGRLHLLGVGYRIVSGFLYLRLSLFRTICFPCLLLPLLYASNSLPTP